MEVSVTQDMLQNENNQTKKLFEPTEVFISNEKTIKGSMFDEQLSVVSCFPALSTV